MSGDEGDTKAPWGSTIWRTVTLYVMGLLGAATLVALIVTLREANHQRDRALELQSHSYDVMILARTLSGTIARSEASLGRYVISADKQQGQLYFDEWRLASDQIDRLDQITEDNHEQQPRINRLRAAYETRGRELSLVALSTTYSMNKQALARYYKARQASSLTAIDKTLDVIITRELAILEHRNAIAGRSVDRSTRVASVLAAFGLLLVLGGIALGWLTVRAFGERATARADAEAADARAEELSAAVTKATDELRIQEAKLRQVQKMEAVGQLTGGIAHDFNNMLAVVLGGLELAKRHLGIDREVTARHIESATEGANRAAALTRRLLAFSREESLRPEPIAASELVAGMSDLLDRTLGDAITLHSEDAAQGWRVRADRVQLENAVLNLAVNARDAMDGRGNMTIATGAITLEDGAVGACAAGDYVTIAVTDEGCGMEPDIVERVFEPFYTTKAVGKGTGLGLSQIFALVRQLGGEIAIRTAPGDGTTVTLYLPRDTAEAPASAVVDMVAVVREAPSPLQILVVEDDPRVLAATMGALDELGHRAVACDDPLAAPGMIERHDGIDLVISDVLMPRQTGPEMIAGLAERFPHVAVLFVTGYAGEAGGAAEFGGHHVLRKPFTIAALERAIEEAMTSDRPAAPESIAAE